MSLRSCTAVLLLLGAAATPAQDVTGREQRLVDVHARLLDLPPGDAPGAFAPWQLDVGAELTVIPVINGDVGPKREITASDHARVFPRPRLVLGLPAPPGFRAFVGAAYIPPVEINRVTVNSIAGEAGLAWLSGPWRLGLRVHAVQARALSPVSSAEVRDRLEVLDLGWELSAGATFRLGKLALSPYAGAGQVRTRGDFRSAVDGGEVHSTHTGSAFYAGARALYRDHWEAVAEYSAYPGRLWNPRFRVGYVVDLGW